MKLRNDKENSNLYSDLQINKTKVKKALAGEAEKLIYNL